MQLNTETKPVAWVLQIDDFPDLICFEVSHSKAILRAIRDYNDAQLGPLTLKLPKIICNRAEQYDKFSDDPEMHKSLMFKSCLDGLTNEK